MELNYYKIIEHFTIALDISFILFLLFKYFGYLSDFWSSNYYVFYFVIFINTLFLALKIKKIPEEERKDSRMIYIYSYLFLLTLIIFFLNQFVKIQQIINLMPYLIGFFISFGFLTFYSYRNRFEKEIEQEKIDEEKEGEKRKKEFSEKFPRINKIPIFRDIIKWIYKEGWWYTIGFLFMIGFFFLTRLYSLNYIDGSDNFDDVALKGLYENGFSYYKYSLISTYFSLGLLKIFGWGIPLLKIPYIIYSFITFVIVYFIAKFINKKVALISLFLFVTSPWSIILSKITRDYSFDCMIGSIVLLIGINLYKRFQINNKNLRYLVYLFVISGIIYILTKINNRVQTLIVLTFIFVIFVFIVYDIIKKQSIINFRFEYLYLIGTIIIFILIILFIRYSFFYPLDKSNYFYFDVFFNPLTESPWQWFHGRIILLSLCILSIFLIPLMFIKEQK